MYLNNIIIKITKLVFTIKTIQYLYLTVINSREDLVYVTKTFKVGYQCVSDKNDIDTSANKYLQVFL